MKISSISFLIIFTIFLQSIFAQETQTVAEATAGLQINNRTDEERIEFLLNVANVYFAEEEMQSAVDAYERVLEIDPDHRQANYIVAHVYISAKMYGKAEALLKKLIENDPEDFKLMNNLAWLYATAEDPKYRSGANALKYAQEAMILAPNDHHVWSTVSEAHYINGEYEKAYRAITHMASLASRFGKGVTKEQVESYNEQIRKCKRAWDTEKMLKGEDDEDEITE
ncbi:tetratricopeptide repeat protein [Pontiellaceae bacterium B12227]|nr:tetratricopeptide repeat protein [Pontiellaceae bacterium B12227]